MTKQLSYGLLTLIFVATSQFLFSQDNKKDLDTAELVLNWKTTYKTTFTIDTASYFQFIKADSVFIHSWVIDEYKADFTGSDYCWIKAEKYANKELAENISSLCKTLKQADALTLLVSQKNWQKYYENERQFIGQSFNYNTSLMAYYRYMIIKSRILFIKNYSTDLKHKR